MALQEIDIIRIMADAERSGNSEGNPGFTEESGLFSLENASRRRKALGIWHQDEPIEGFSRSIWDNASETGSAFWNRVKNTQREIIAASREMDKNTKRPGLCVICSTEPRGIFEEADRA